METQGQDAVQQEMFLQERMKKIQHKVVVMSGKGGVGKTTVAVNLAHELADKGNKVGILDVDIHGPNIAKMLGIEDVKLAGSPDGIEPHAVSANLKALSISMLLENADQPIIWRGPRKTAVIRQFLSDVNWGELDYMVIDTPPGTGDESLGVCQAIPDITGAIIVTTPQDVAILDSRKSVLFAKSIKVPVVGVVENMSGFVCPHCNKAVMLFGEGGGEKAAYELLVPFLGRIPMESQMVIQGDSGKPFIASHKGTSAAKAMDDIVENIISFLKKQQAGSAAN